MQKSDEEIKKEVKKHLDYISKRASLAAYRNYTQLFSYFAKVLKRTRIPFLKRELFLGWRASAWYVKKLAKVSGRGTINTQQAKR